MDIETRREIAKSIGPALHRSTHNYSVALIDFKTFEVASGTLVEIGSHAFVCTCGHFLPATVDGRLFLLGEKARKFAEGMPAYLGHQSIDRNGIDVGYVEIDRAAVSPLLGNKSFLPLSLIEDLGTGDPKMLTALTGFPVHTVGNPVVSGQVVPAFWSACNLPIAVTDYPTRVEPMPVDALPPDAEKDVFLEYEDNDQIRDLSTYQKVERLGSV